MNIRPTVRDFWLEATSRLTKQSNNRCSQFSVHRLVCRRVYVCLLDLTLSFPHALTRTRLFTIIRGGRRFQFLSDFAAGHKVGLVVIVSLATEREKDEGQVWFAPFSVMWKSPLAGHAPTAIRAELVSVHQTLP